MHSSSPVIRRHCSSVFGTDVGGTTAGRPLSTTILQSKVGPRVVHLGNIPSLGFRPCSKNGGQRKRGLLPASSGFAHCAPLGITWVQPSKPACAAIALPF